MKKMMKYLLFALLLTATVLALASCGHEHQYAEAWSKDGSHHWHAYTCEHGSDERVPVSELATHTLGSAVTVDATCTATGKQTVACTVCGYTMEKVLAANGHSYTENKHAYMMEGETLFLYTYCDTCDAPVKTAVEGNILPEGETLTTPTPAE